MLSLICKSRFKNLNFLILYRGAIGKILNKIIFFEKIRNTFAMAK